jgi:CHAT domain-containing protein
VVGSTTSLRRERPYYTVEELGGAEREIEAVAEALGVYPVRGSKSDTLSALRRHSYVHIACHGHLNPEEPMESGLILGNEVLTVRELLKTPIDCHLVVLSACHSAFVSPQPGDPFVSLSAALLYAGAHHVLAAQWAVSDEITTSFITRFYQDFRGQAPDSFGIASSLSTVMHSFEREQAEPYYWAPFGVFGGCD